MVIVLDYFKIFGFEDVYGELENVYRIGKRRDDKVRYIIAKLYSRFFKRNLFRVAKSLEKKDMFNGVRIVEDFLFGDFELRKKVLLKMKVVFEVGLKVRFIKGKLLIDGKVVLI